MKPVKHIAYSSLQPGPDDRQATFTARLLTSVIATSLFILAFFQLSDPLAMPQKAGIDQIPVDPIENAATLEELRGIEGEAAQLYFDGFDSLILQQRESFAFNGRSRRLHSHFRHGRSGRLYHRLLFDLRHPLRVDPWPHHGTCRHP